MQVCFSFDKAAVERQGYTLETVRQTVKRLFAVHGLPCVSEDGVLAFKDKGHGDKDGEEDILSQAGKA